MRSARTLVIALALVGCSPSRDAISTRVDLAERRVAENAETYALTEADHRAMRRLAREIDGLVMQALRDYTYATQTFDDAKRRSDAASAGYAAAARDYERAAARYRRVMTILALAAASDLFLRGVCGPRVSTAQHRRALARAGVDLEGIDIDHIVARARGGPDQPWNYLPLEASINRSLGAGGLWWKLLNFPLQTLEALAKNASYQLLCP